MTSPASIRILFAATALSLASSAVFAQSTINLSNSGTLAGNMSKEGVRSYKPTTESKGTGTTAKGTAPGSMSATVATIGTSTDADPSIGTNTGSDSYNTTTGGGSGGTGSIGSGGTDSNGLGDFVGPPYLTGLNDTVGGMACLPGMSDCGGSTGIIGGVIGGTGINPGVIGSVVGGTPGGIDWNTLIQIGAPLIGAVSGNQTAAQIGSLLGSGANLLQNGSLIPNENWTAAQWANLVNMGIQVGAAANKDNSNWQNAANIATAGTTMLNGYNALNNNRQQPQLTQIGVSSTGQPIYQQTTMGGAYSGQTTYNNPITGVAQSVLQAGQTPGINGNTVYTAGTQYVSNQVGQVAGNAASGLYSSTSPRGVLGTVGTAGSQYVNNQVRQLTGNSTLSSLIGSGVSSAANQIGQTFNTKPLQVETSEPAYTKPLQVETSEPAYTKPLQVETSEPAYTKPLQVDNSMYDWIP